MSEDKEGYRVPVSRPDDEFRRSYRIAVGVLVVLCLAFLGLTWFQGPKLDDAQVDIARVVTQADQQLRLFTNQAVAQISADQVSITPETPFTVAVADDVIAVQFTEKLRYDTEYTVEVSGVTSVYQDQPSMIRHTFTIPPAEILFLDRADPTVEPDGKDVIKRSNVVTGETEVVYSAPRIQRFLVVGQALLVQTLQADGTNSLQLVSLVDQVVEQLILPAEGTVDGLQASGGVIAFAFTEANPTENSEYLATLLHLDLEGPHDFAPVLGLNGKPLQVVDWVFVPDSAEILALNTDHSLLRIGLAEDAAVVPLKSYERLGRISPDGTTLIVGTVFDLIELSLGDGSELPFAPSPLDGVVPFGGDVQPLAGGNGRVQKVTDYNFETNEAKSFLVFDDGTTSRALFSTAGVAGIEDFTVSGNGQYVAVEVVPSVEDMVADGYYPDARATSVVTQIIDIRSGAVVREVPGFAVSW